MADKADHFPKAEEILANAHEEAQRVNQQVKQDGQSNAVRQRKEDMQKLKENDKAYARLVETAEKARKGAKAGGRTMPTAAEVYAAAHADAYRAGKDVHTIVAQPEGEYVDAEILAALDHGMPEDIPAPEVMYVTPKNKVAVQTVDDGSRKK